MHYIVVTTLKFFYPILTNHPSGNHEWDAKRYRDQFVDDQSNGAVCAGDDAAECTLKLEHNAIIFTSCFPEVNVVTLNPRYIYRVLYWLGYEFIYSKRP